MCDVGNAPQKVKLKDDLSVEESKQEAVSLQTHVLQGSLRSGAYFGLWLL